MPDLSSEIPLDALFKLCEKTGDEILRFFKKKLNVRKKADGTPVTVVDEIAHKMVTEGLGKLSPKIPILSEESSRINFQKRRLWQDFWLIDPLDGTRDFVRGVGEFCVCIAKISGNLPVFGIIYDPIKREYYLAEAGGDAYKIRAKNQHKIRVREAHKPFQIVIGHHSLGNRKLQMWLAKMPENYHLNRCASALKFCRIAEGRFDCYPRFGPCSEWDTAAGSCILQAAGGRVVDENGAPLRYNTGENLTSPVFFASGG